MRDSLKVKISRHCMFHKKYNNEQEILPSAAYDPVSMNLLKEWVPTFYLDGMRKNLLSNTNSTVK